MTQHTRTLRLTRELGTLEPMLKKVARGSQTLIRGQDVFGILEKRTRKNKKKRKGNTSKHHQRHHDHKINN